MNRLLPTLLAAAVLALGMPGRAQAQAPDAAAERQRLRSELERVNAEIDRLKQPDRGVRDDYRLRQRMADAEALARRLTELEARAGTAGSPRATATAAAPAPAAAPGDGPAELEAKADVLTDQARRLAAQAEALEARSAQLQARQELRRRSSQMDRDPLSPFDGSKRRMVSGLATSATTPNSTTGQDKAASGAASPIPIVSPSSPSRPETSWGGATVLSTAMTVQFRDYLDPATLADIRKIESSRGPGWEAQAMRRAAEALRSRSAELGRTAELLRKQAHR